MLLLNLVQAFELDFWKLIILLLQEEGPVMKIAKWVKKIIRSKSGHLTLLLVIWSVVGFIGGLVIGRIIWMLQLM